MSPGTERSTHPSVPGDLRRIGGAVGEELCVAVRGVGGEGGALCDVISVPRRLATETRVEGTHAPPYVQVVGCEGTGDISFPLLKSSHRKMNGRSYKVRNRAGHIGYFNLGCFKSRITRDWDDST